MDTFIESSTAHLEDLEENDHNTLYNEKKWEWSFLRRKCRNLELEQFYESYMSRLRLSFISLFIFIGALVATVHSIILLATVKPVSEVTVDIGMYFGAAGLVWLVLSINFREDFVNRNTWIMYASSWVATTILVVADLGVPIYHAVSDHDILRPSYGSYILYAIYIFMPLPNNFHAFILGLAVTASYLVNYGFVTYRKLEHNVDKLDTTKLISECIFLLGINLLGIYFRVMREIAIRTTFLDRRQCVEENLLLRYARDQERSLLLSIIPAQIANKIEQDVKLRIEHIKQQNLNKGMGTNLEPSRSPIVKRWRPRQQDTEKLFIEPHNDVSILYADVVNYTQLTTTLDVKTLVTTLHDLFVRFDTASEEFNVLRIKFLGDCYYCVAGVPIPNEQHAKCCTLLGLRMIKDIREVRQKRKLDIDMRIGVHSGNILSGVIGANKWQFDIWSKDVDVANRLESTGVAGRVHVSEQTLKLLDGEFLYEEGTEKARNDEVLRKYQIHTFLIKPPKGSSTFITSSTLMSKGSMAQTSKQSVNFRNSVVGVRRYKASAKSDPNTNFMQNTISQYNQIRAQAKLEMNRELDKMPIGRIQVSKVCFGHSKRLTQDEMEEQSFRSNITSLFLFFKDWRWEVLFMKEPDVMLKYSVLFGVITFFGIMAIQAINESLSLYVWNFNIINSVLILLFLIIVWYRKLWIMLIADAENSLPVNRISAIMYNLSDKIQSNIVARVIIYLAMVAMQCICALMQLVDCDRFQTENEEIDLQLFQDGVWNNLCFNPWAVTESLALVICMGFLFTRIPFVLKLTTGVIIFGCYAIIVLFEYDFIYEKSPTTNVGLYPEYSHLLMLIITIGIFHLMDRQTEFITKVDYNWKRQLQKKQDDAKFTNETIKILINNILPAHVADIYITKQMRNELYFEEYDNVAVMFATIKNYDKEKVGLRVLNEIICDFDAVLNTYKGKLKIEKIKVAGWTYMAACGLDIARSETSIASNRSSSLLPNGRRSHYNDSSRSSQEIVLDVSQLSSPGSSASAVYEGHNKEKRKSRKISSPEQSNVVYVMAQFALDLMRTMHAFNSENWQNEDGDKGQGMLSIGISNGEIMAGVVGSYKPHYDIWGNAVNMASRMDSTGKPGLIQVTEETADILRTFDIHCIYRGQTYVKGRGKIPTYFIAIDKNFNFTSVNDGMTRMSAMSIVFPSKHELDTLLKQESNLSQTPSEEVNERKESYADKDVRRSASEEGADSEVMVRRTSYVKESVIRSISDEELPSERSYGIESRISDLEKDVNMSIGSKEAPSLAPEEASVEEVLLKKVPSIIFTPSAPQELSADKISQNVITDNTKIDSDTTLKDLILTPTKSPEPSKPDIPKPEAPKPEVPEPSLQEPEALIPEHTKPDIQVPTPPKPVPKPKSPIPEISEPEPPKPEPKPPKPEAPKPEPEPPKPEPPKPEPEPPKPEPPKPEPLNPEPLKPEPLKPEPPKPEPTKPEPPMPEPPKPEPPKPEPPKPEPPKPEPPMPEPPKPEPPKPEPPMPEPPKPEPPKIVPKPEVPKQEVTAPVLPASATQASLYYSDKSEEDLATQFVKPVVLKPEVPKQEITAPVLPASSSQASLYYSDKSEEGLVTEVVKPVVPPIPPKPKVHKPMISKTSSKETLYYSDISDIDIVSRRVAPQSRVSKESIESNTTKYYSDKSDEDLVPKPKFTKPPAAKPEVFKPVVPRRNSNETLYYSDISDMDIVSKSQAPKPQVAKPDVSKTGSQDTLYDDVLSSASDTFSKDETSQGQSKK